FTFDGPVDPGLANWAREYLNERLEGVHLGSAQLRRELDDPSLNVAERSFVEGLRPAFIDVLDAEQRLFVADAAGLLDEVPAEQLIVYRRVLASLEPRAQLLD